MRKLTVLLLLLLCLPLTALAVEMSLTPYEMGFDYDITGADPWIRLCWKAENDRGMKTLYSPDGNFSGSVALPYGAAGGKYTVTIENLNAAAVLKKSVRIPQAADYVAPTGKSNAKITDLTLGETTTGFTYSFNAPGTDFVMLYYRSMNEEVCFPVYPATAEGFYEGEIVSKLVQPRDLFTVQIRTAKGTVKKEGKVRMAYEAPEPAQAQPGRLSGLVVCLDAGHHENHTNFKEDLGPGLSGSKVNTGGMAQGRETYRRESIVVLETAMILRDMLLKEGATVVMTRTAQTDFRTNIDRCNIAEEGGAQIMLRLHCNMNDNARKTGIQIYCPRNSDYAKALATPDEYRALATALMNEMKKATGMALEQKTGNVVINDNYVGNNWAKMLCFLVEMGYMSNVGEDIKLATPEYQTMLAKGMLEGVYQIALMRGLIAE